MNGVVNTSLICSALWMGALTSPAQLLFSDDFEAGLSRWTGKPAQPHHGILVPDPLSTGRGQVLTFTNLDRSGDIFSTNRISSSDLLLLSFDYLGLAQTGSVTGDFGGFVGITPVVGQMQFAWIAATSPLYPSAYQLPDDGQWHRAAILLNGPTVGAFHLALEDWTNSLGVPGDVYFDNIEIVTVTRPNLSIRISQADNSQVELCWPTDTNLWYQLQYRPALTGNTWWPLGTNWLRGTGGILCTNDAIVPGQAARFYQMTATNFPAPP